MQNFKFIKNYKDDTTLRNSFNSLANETFGINFENWYAKGYWNDKYEPYSFCDGDRIIANVSVNKLDLVIQGEKKPAIQIGTVMTHPDYRNQGLSASLMNRVIEEYEPICDIMYLFANHTVLNFYPKFGFVPTDEHQFSLEYSMPNKGLGTVRKLDGNNENDRTFLYQFASRRCPVSNYFGTDRTADLLMFYCLYVFTHDFYYLEEQNAIVVFKQDGGTIHVFDIISHMPVDYESILKQISNRDTSKILFHFTPDLNMSPAKHVCNGHEVLFVKMKEGVELPKYFKHPITSQA